MGKFQLNKKGEDPIKIYEDAFKIAEGTVETHLDKLGKQPKPISREAHDIFGDPDNQDSDFQWHKADSSDLLKTNQPVRNPDGTIYSIPFDYQWNQNLQDQVGRADYRSNYPSSESEGTDHDNDGDIDSEDYLKSKDIAIKSNIEEADNFPQKDFGSIDQWEDDLDELRGLGGKLPDTNALWNSVEAIAREVTAQDIVNKLNSNLPSNYYPRETSHIKNIEDLGNGNVRFGYSGGVINDEIKNMFESSGFTISNVNNIMDAGHLDAEGKITESYASEDSLIKIEDNEV